MTRLTFIGQKEAASSRHAVSRPATLLAGRVARCVETRDPGTLLQRHWVPAFAGMTALLMSLSGLGWSFGKSDVGTSGASFLKIGPGARPAAMGEAFTGVADDIHAIYWNPAGLAKLKHPELTGMHMQWFQNVSYEFAAFAYPTKKHGTWGFAVTNLHTDDIERRTEDTDAAIDTFGMSDSAYWLSYAYPLTEKLSVGANAKYIRLSLDSVNANAYAMDGGVTYDTGWHGLRLGSSLQNLGSNVKYTSESDPLPLAMRFGASVQPIPKKLLLSSDIIVPRDHEVGFALGGEYRKRMSQAVGYSIRSGYRSDTDVDGFAGVSAGGGLEFGRAGFDFTWVPFGDLGNSYRYALHLKFGPPAKDANSIDGILEQSSKDKDIDPALALLNDSF